MATDVLHQSFIGMHRYLFPMGIVPLEECLKLSRLSYISESFQLLKELHRPQVEAQESPS